MVPVEEADQVRRYTRNVLVQASDVGLSFGIDIILEGVSFRIDRREKVALVGRNGTGKTSLLRMLTGQIEPDRGNIHIARGAKIGFLRQESPVTLGRTVLAEVESAMAEQTALRLRLTELEARLEAGATEDDLEEYALLQEHFLESEGYSLDHDVQVVLRRMGFEESEWSRLTDGLSGGEKTRLALARLLFAEPDLLILDEPTNHLDLEATEWLERWIKSYHGAVLLVSHDRAFLQATAERVLELRDHTLKAYPGNYDQYVRLRAEYEANLAMQAERQAEAMAKLDEYVRRFINSQRTAQARGRQKMLERLEENRIEAPKQERGIQAGFRAAKRSGDLVVSCRKLAVGFPDATLIPSLDWTVRQGERWGVIGENGAGKSTLIRTILGRHEALAGEAKLGSSLTIGLFWQDVSELPLEDSPLQYMMYEAGMDAAPARNLLGRFLITGDDVYRPIRTLSGGEKNKLVLARLTQESPNLLVLDEPTNHLDMDSREALAAVLREYRGTLILVSHDRWLLSQVADHILDVRRGGCVTFDGTYEEYRGRRDRPVATAPATPMAVASRREEPATTLSPRELSKEIQRLTALVEQLEHDVESREKSVADLERQLASVPADADILQMTRDYQAAQEALAAELSAWEEQAGRLEQLRGQQGPG